MKIYTKTGDGGETGLFSGPRVSKDDARIEAYGTVDELNAFLGLARAESLPPKIDSVLERIQHGLFAVGAELASPDPVAAKTKMVGADEIAWLEATIDSCEATLEPLRQFILPAGTRAATALHVARGVCRRAERRVVTLLRASQEPISGEVIQYLNRLGDLLFSLARSVNASAGESDHPWVKPQPPK
ncbi:MAG TPA: cob(I)yrinic acid a,c-diamide adenosyltransferase [Pirellulaceae bacterium]|nr:cob(I)yrinic acid a,c-diamide adenosyltransferase [Planctomycetales bacterium]MCB9937899.1 cob(I)yrinic acid a,c-diamide adenosyltransferase [Planctomycetaceae bacterium]HRX79451.1 cob(I)yrinic acid a,c-diamide adenosyltransferase [Pirellulaceae bacterium]